MINPQLGRLQGPLLRAEGSSGKVLNVVIFVESVVHRSNWRSRETETVGNSRKQSGAARRDHAKIVNPPFFKWF